jgi:hypothetical protein
LDRQKKSQLKYDSAVIEKLVAIAQFGKPRSFLIVNFGLTQSDEFRHLVQMFLPVRLRSFVPSALRQ